MCVYNKNAETTGGDNNSNPERVYGYLDLFKTMGDTCPIQTYQMTLTKLVIGRESSCQIRIKNSRVSRQQCAVFAVYDKQQNLQVRLKNLTTRPTTVLRNKGISPGEEIVLQHGDRFRLYDVELRYRLYDPVNEQGQLDWSRPIPAIKLAPTSPPPQAKPEKTQLPSIKVSIPADELPGQRLTPPSNNARRQSFPLSAAKKSLTNQLKLSRSNSMKLPVADDSRQRKLTDQEMKNNNKNANKLQPPVSTAYKRRGSSDFDMRKAVLQRSFRRAFKEKITQGSFIDVNDDGPFRRALDNYIVRAA